MVIIIILNKNISLALNVFWYNLESLQRQHLHHHTLVTFINTENGSYYVNMLTSMHIFTFCIVFNKLLMSEAESNFIQLF